MLHNDVIYMLSCIIDIFFQFTIDSHSKTISTLKNRVSFAESAASRAREELKQVCMIVNNRKKYAFK